MGCGLRLAAETRAEVAGQMPCPAAFNLAANVGRDRSTVRRHGHGSHFLDGHVRSPAEGI